VKTGSAQRSGTVPLKHTVNSTAPNALADKRNCQKVHPTFSPVDVQPGWFHTSIHIPGRSAWRDEASRRHYRQERSNRHHPRCHQLLRLRARNPFVSGPKRLLLQLRPQKSFIQTSMRPSHKRLSRCYLIPTYFAAQGPVALDGTFRTNAISRPSIATSWKFATARCQIGTEPLGRFEKRIRTRQFDRGARLLHE